MVRLIPNGTRSHPGRRARVCAWPQEGTRTTRPRGAVETAKSGAVRDAEECRRNLATHPATFTGEGAAYVQEGARVGARAVRQRGACAPRRRRGPQAQLREGRRPLGVESAIGAVRFTCPAGPRGRRPLGRRRRRRWAHASRATRAGSGSRCAEPLADEQGRAWPRHRAGAVKLDPPLGHRTRTALLTSKRVVTDPPRFTTSLAG